jgi:choice-of-anchor B domain-containing protein
MKHFLRTIHLVTATNNMCSSIVAIALLCAILASGTVIANSRDSRSHPQHDDHGGNTPVEQGTDGELCTSGVSAGFACKNIELLSRMPLATIGGGGGADSWGWKDTQTDRYYALMARSTGTSFIDVSNPEEPVYLGNLPSAAENSPWRDVKVYANHAFVVADDSPNHGMQVFDLTRLRGIDAPQQFTADALYRGVGSAHNVAINEDSGYAYIVGSQECAGGLHMVDIRIPKAPVFAGCFSDDGYTHDVQCVTYSGPDVDHQGAEVCFGSNEDSVTVVDVSDKSAPVMLGKADYPFMGYSHQGWLDETQGIFFMGDELDELNFGMNTRTMIFDVQDLDNPVYAGAHRHASSVIDHNLYVNGNHIFQANYQAGLRIFRIDRGQNINLEEVAYFDTSPEKDNRDFAGAWNVYPFFDNGTILVSDINNGLFVLRASLADDAAESSPLNGRMSGLWTSEGLNDQGITLFVGENNLGPFVFFAWFLYLEGEPFWLVGNTPFEYGVDEVAIPVQRLDGLPFMTPGVETANRENIGTLNIHVHGCNELHVQYDFGVLGSKELAFERLTAVQGRECQE